MITFRTMVYMATGEIVAVKAVPRGDLTLHEELPVTQVTTEGSVNIPQYFTHRSWLRDGKSLIYVSNMTGSLELHLLDVEKGEITQLTSGSNVLVNAWAITPDDKHVLYTGGGQDQEEYRLVNIATFEDHLVARRPPECKGFGRSIIDVAPDGDSFYTCCSKLPEKIPSNLLIGSIKAGTVERFFPDDEGNANYFDHQMACPANSRLLQVNKTPASAFGRGDAPQRMWLLDLETKALRPLYKQKRGAFNAFQRVCHEAWLPGGQHLCYVVRRDKVGICNIDGEFGNELAWTAGRGPNFWHVSASPDGKLLCADTMWRDTGLWLIEVKDNTEGRLFPLCLTRSAWQHPVAFEHLHALPQVVDAHPHPGWSPDGRHVHFTAFSPNALATHVFLVNLERLDVASFDAYKVWKKRLNAL